MIDQGNQISVTQHNGADGSRSLSAEYTGSLPHPAIVEKYDNLVPGAAREILDMAKSEQQHRHRGQQIDQQIRLMMARKDRQSTLLGQITGFVVIMVGLIGAIYLIIHGKSTEGLAMILSPLAGVAALFIYATKSGNLPSRSKQSTAPQPKDGE